MIWQLKEFSQATYLSFSDDLKIKMTRQQFAYSEDQQDEIKTWLRSNINEPYFIEQKGHFYWVQFLDAADAAAFKLRWS